MDDDNIKRAVEALLTADALLITAGAGIGVDSGLPDFRGNEGFWNAYPPIARLGIPFYEMANPKWFDSNPTLAWAFYGHRLNLYRRTIPHHGFLKLHKQAMTKKAGYFVFTSNVDGQFQKAGFSSEQIVECHGSIHHLQCSIPCDDSIWNAEHIEVRVDEENFEASEPFPACPHCQAVARPNILMFGDWGWLSSRTNEQDQRLKQWLYMLSKAKLKLTIIEIGAGGAVPTVRQLSERVSAQLMAPLIRINPRDFQVPGGQISVPFSAIEGIDLIIAN